VVAVGLVVSVPLSLLKLVVLVRFFVFWRVSGAKNQAV